MIIFIHGFNTVPSESGIKWLKDNFNTEVISPYMNYINPTELNKTIADIEQSIEDSPDEIVIIGRSIGGFISEYLGNKHKIHCILINPAIFPEVTLKPYENQNTIVNFKTGKINNVDSNFIFNILQYKSEHSKGIVYLGDDDRIIDVVATEEELKGNYEICKFKGGHSVKMNILPGLKNMIDYYLNYIGCVNL